MLGALIGDIAGSIYEWHNHKSKDFPFLQPQCRMTDDSIMTTAIAAAVLEGIDDLDEFKAHVITQMRDFGAKYPGRGYGPRFEHWLTSPEPQPYHSLGNGSAMRVSPVAWAAESLPQCLALAKASAEVTHDHPDGIAGACAVAASAVLTGRSGRGVPILVQMPGGTLEVRILKDDTALLLGEAAAAFTGTVRIQPCKLPRGVV